MLALAMWRKHLLLDPCLVSILKVELSQILDF